MPATVASFTNVVNCLFELLRYEESYEYVRRSLNSLLPVSAPSMPNLFLDRTTTLNAFHARCLYYADAREHISPLSRNTALNFTFLSDGNRNFARILLLKMKIALPLVLII